MTSPWLGGPRRGRLAVRLPCVTAASRRGRLEARPPPGSVAPPHGRSKGAASGVAAPEGALEGCRPLRVAPGQSTWRRALCPLRRSPFAFSAGFVTQPCPLTLNTLWSPLFMRPPVEATSPSRPHTLGTYVSGSLEAAPGAAPRGGSLHTYSQRLMGQGFSALAAVPPSVFFPCCFPRTLNTVQRPLSLRRLMLLA